MCMKYKTLSDGKNRKEMVQKSREKSVKKWFFEKINKINF